MAGAKQEQRRVRRELGRWEENLGTSLRRVLGLGTALLARSPQQEHREGGREAGIPLTPGCQDLLAFSSTKRPDTRPLNTQAVGSGLVAPPARCSEGTACSPEGPAAVVLIISLPFPEMGEPDLPKQLSPWLTGRPALRGRGQRLQRGRVQASHQSGTPDNHFSLHISWGFICPGFCFPATPTSGPCSLSSQPMNRT